MKMSEITEAYDIMKRIEDYYERLMLLQESAVVDVFTYESEEHKEHEDYNTFSFSLEERLFIIEGYRAAIDKLKEELKARGIEE